MFSTDGDSCVFGSYVVPGTESVFIKYMPGGQMNGFAKWTNELSSESKIRTLGLICLCNGEEFNQLLKW